jgi:autotransporter-associated beta strand protein
VDIRRGIVRAGADNVIPAIVGHGGLVLGSTDQAGSVATFDLNGTTQTINALTATTDGTVVIDNSSAAAAVFRFGANDSAVNFGAGVGNYTIQNSGGGALDIVKLGNTTATFISGLNLNHSGITASEGGGVFNIASPLTATSGLRAMGGSILSLTGGLTNPGLITSIEVGGGSALSLLDGAGSLIANLESLSLGHTGTGTATLNLNIGDGATDTLTLLTGGALNLGNSVTFNLTDAGLSANTTYTLLNSIGGGLTSGSLAGTDWIQGATPGGFDGFVWNVTDNLIQLTTGNLILGNLYWRGGTDNTWNGNLNNWSENKDGTGEPLGIPGQGNDVIFAWDNPGSVALVTTLEQNFKINSLTFEPGGITTPAAVTLAPGELATARLEIKPQDAVVGIEMKAGGPGLVAISANLKLGDDQTWTVADATSRLAVSGALDGTGALTLAGAGTLQLASPALPTFGVPSVTINGGRLEIQDVGALGSAANANLADLLVNSGGTFFTNTATASTTANAITLAGGTLAAGGNAQTYSSTVNVTAASTITMLDPVTLANGRSITLSGGLSGTGALTVDSIDTVTGGNQITGTLTLNQDNSDWSGNWNLLRGTISTNNENGLGSGSTITAEKGRILFTGTAGDRTLGHDVVIASATENALLEFNQASGIAMTYTGGVTLGNASHTAELRVLMASDAATATFTGGILLANNGLIGTQNSASRVLHIDSVISEIGGARSLRINDGTWGGTAGTVRLTGLNTFSGNVTVARGILEFDTVTNVGGAASSLGQGSAITLGAQAASTLRFIGDGAANSQTTNRPITITPDGATNFAGTLDARGTDGASITYAGTLNVTPNADGSWLVLTGLAGSEGHITGGWTQPGVSADVNVTGGTWTLLGTAVTVADDLFVQTPNAVLVLGSTGVLTWGESTTNYLDIRNGGTLRLAANETIAAGIERLYVGQGSAGEVAILDTKDFTATTPVELTALIELESRGETFFYFLGPKAGGTEIKVAGQEILVITPESPLGKELAGKKTGDRIKLQTGGPAQEFRVLSVR